MPQYPGAVLVGLKGTTPKAVPVDSTSGALLVTDIESLSTLHVTVASAIATVAGSVDKVCVVAAPSAAGGVYDIAAVSLAAAANQIATIPTVTGILSLDDFPFSTGLVIDPNGGTVSVSYRKK